MKSADQFGKKFSTAIGNRWAVVILWFKVLICFLNPNLLAGANSGKLYLHSSSEISYPDVHPDSTFIFPKRLLNTFQEQSFVLTYKCLWGRIHSLDQILQLLNNLWHNKHVFTMTQQGKKWAHFALNLKRNVGGYLRHTNVNGILGPC